MKLCAAAPAILALAGVASTRGVTVDPALPRYRATPVEVPAGAPYLRATGEVTVVGYNDMKEMLAEIGAQFTALHPAIRFAWDLPGTKAAPVALATGRSAFAPMGAPLTPAQRAAYAEITPAVPLEFRVAHASLDPRALSGPLAIFVHRDNPLTSLTLDELAAIFSGAGTARRLRPIGVAADTALGLFFRERVLQGREFAKDFTGLAQSADVVQQVGGDVGAIGFAAACRATPAVKFLALADRAGLPPIALTQENILAGRYPLDRHLLICARAPLEPWVREFLRFVLSRDGQQIVADGTLGYLPLSAVEAASERAKLEAAP